MGSRSGFEAVGMAAVVSVLSCGAALAQGFSLDSPDLASGSFDEHFVLDGFGCTGDNVSPALEWSNLPEGTRSLALQVHDPDAPTGAGFWHWAVYNIPPTADGLAQGAGNAPEALPAPAYGGNTDFMDTGVIGRERQLRRPVSPRRRCAAPLRLHPLCPGGRRYPGGRRHSPDRNGIALLVRAQRGRRSRAPGHRVVHGNLRSLIDPLRAADRRAFVSRTSRPAPPPARPTPARVLPAPERRRRPAGCREGRSP